MPQQKEIWDLYDKDYKKCGIFVRGHGMIRDGYYHKTVEVIPTDMEGTLLLTRRSANKTSGAGQLEFPAGSVISGETEEEAALRELKEETGLEPKKIFFLQRARTKGIIRYTYLVYIPTLKTDTITCPPEEIMGYRFVTYDQWTTLLTTSEYNRFRLPGYTKELLSVVEKLVNRYRDEAAGQQQKLQERPPLTVSAGLGTKKPRHLDHRCYEEEVIVPDGLENWEPPWEQGDDGT